MSTADLLEVAMQRWHIRYECCPCLTNTCLQCVVDRKSLGLNNPTGGEVIVDGKADWRWLK